VKVTTSQNIVQLQEEKMAIGNGGLDNLHTLWYNAPVMLFTCTSTIKFLEFLS